MSVNCYFLGLGGTFEWTPATSENFCSSALFLVFLFAAVCGYCFFSSSICRLEFAPFAAVAVAAAYLLSSEL